MYSENGKKKKENLNAGASCQSIINTRYEKIQKSRQMCWKTWARLKWCAILFRFQCDVKLDLNIPCKSAWIFTTPVFAGNAIHHWDISNLILMKYRCTEHHHSSLHTRFETNPTNCLLNSLRDLMIGLALPIKQKNTLMLSVCQIN